MVNGSERQIVIKKPEESNQRSRSPPRCGESERRRHGERMRGGLSGGGVHRRKEGSR